MDDTVPEKKLQEIEMSADVAEKDDKPPVYKDTDLK